MYDLTGKKVLVIAPDTDIDSCYTAHMILLRARSPDGLRWQVRFVLEQLLTGSIDEVIVTQDCELLWQLFKLNIRPLFPMGGKLYRLANIVSGHKAGYPDNTEPLLKPGIKYSVDMKTTPFFEQVDRTNRPINVGGTDV